MKLKRYRFFLIPFSFIYFLLISLRNIFYSLHIFKQYTLNAKVLSVGNITWGGTGKTPAVVFILEELLKRGSKVAILSRGYGNDEQKLLSRLAPGIPVLVGKDRVKSGLEAIATHSVDTVLLDDGFQHRRLKRNLDIVLIDATNPFGNGWVIPCGSMREGIWSLKRADIFLITKVDLVQNDKDLQNLEHKLKRVNPDALIVKCIHSPQHFYKLPDNKIVDLRSLKNKTLALVSAIGNPISFEKTVLKLGLKVQRHFIFRDHHWYSEKDLKRIEDYCKSLGIDTVITTEKDAIKIRTTNHHSTWFDYAHHRLLGTGEPRITNYMVLSIKLKIIENEHAFLNRLFGVYNS